MKNKIPLAALLEEKIQHSKLLTDVNKDIFLKKRVRKIRLNDLPDAGLTYKDLERELEIPHHQLAHYIKKLNIRHVGIAPSVSEDGISTRGRGRLVFPHNSLFLIREHMESSIATNEIKSVAKKLKESFVGDQNE